MMLQQIAPTFILTVLVTMVAQGWATTMSTQHKVGPTEYCSYERFNATCPSGHLILIKSARYGRMRIGRCVLKDLGYLGCAADASPVLDTKCSGRTHCSLAVGDNDLRTTQPCPHDVTWHLEVTYECIPVLHLKDNTSCGSREPSPEMGVEAGYMGSAVTAKTGYGSTNCPWSLKAGAGQKIVISVLNLGFWAYQPQQPGDCQELGTVVERSKRIQINLCGRDLHKRQVQIYSSTSNALKVAVATGMGEGHHFMLKYEVVGCSSLNMPDHVTVRRTHDRVTIVCNSTDITYSLVCTGNKWVGTLGNCSGARSAAASWDIGNIFQNYGNGLPMGILIAVAMGVALGIFLGGILLVVVGSRMKKRQRQKMQRASYIQAPSGYEGAQEKGQISSHHSDRSAFSASDYMTSSIRTDVTSLHDTLGADRLATYRMHGPPNTIERTISHAYETPAVS